MDDRSGPTRSQQERVWEGGNIVVDFFKNFYSTYADTAENEKSKEAALLFCVSEDQIQDGDLSEALSAAERAVELFRDAEDERGIRDSLRLVVHAMRAQADEERNKGERADSRDVLEKAEELIDEELANYRDADDQLGQAAMLLSLAEATCAYRGSTKRDEALDNAEEAREIYAEAGDVKMQGIANMIIAEVLFRKRNFDACRRTCLEAVELFKPIGEKLCMAMTYLLCSASEIRAGVLDSAVRLGRKSAKLLQEAGSKKHHMAALVIVGQYYLMKEDVKSCLQVGEAATALLKELHPRSQIGWEGPVIGFTIESHLMARNYDEALELVNSTLANLRQRENSTREVIHLMHHLLHIHAAREDMDLVKEVFDDGMLLAKEIGCRRSQAHLYEELANAFLVAQDYKQGIAAAKDACNLLKELGADHDEVTTRLQGLVKILLVDGANEEALQHLEMAKELAAKIDERPLEAFCLSIKARVLALLGDPEKGLKAADLAIDMFREDEDRRGECRVYEGLSEVQLAMGDVTASLRSAKRAEAICEDLGDQRLLARIKQAKAGIYQSSSQPQEALDCLIEAVKFSRADDDLRGTVRYILQCMDLHVSILAALDPEDKSKVRIYRQGCEKAMRMAKEAVGIAVRINDRWTEANSHYWVGVMHIMMGRPKEAKVSADSVLEIAQEKTVHDDHSRLVQVQAYSLMAQVCIQEKNHAGAVAKYNEADAIAKEAGNNEAVKTVLSQLKDLVFGSGAQEAAAAAAAAAPVADAAAPAQEAASAAAGEVGAYKGPDPDLMKMHIIAMVKNMTGGGEEVDGDTPLMESGVDSLASVELRTQLQSEFKIALPSTVMFNYPTIQGITGLLVEECTNKQIAWSA
eukprot:TRINITY_DN35587_c0_g1_i1.p1 TRINITY_DN35587_c0_g1~~TRINITY_DN35587_c0_g1_i1.p1  ORF type:complete len:866 (-),score=240.18 TRINITY_DN35587_c0_g1_i1:202-2799(-)